MIVDGQPVACCAQKTQKKKLQLNCKRESALLSVTASVRGFLRCQLIVPNVMELFHALLYKLKKIDIFNQFLFSTRICCPSLLVLTEES